MTVEEILTKIDSAIEPVEDVMALFGINAVPALAATTLALSIYKKIFAAKPAYTEYTQEMIDEEIDNAKESILEELDKMGITYDEDTNSFDIEEDDDL